MVFSRRNFGYYDSALREVDASEERFRRRQIRAEKERRFDSYVRPILVGVGLATIAVLSQMAARENKEFLERKCEQFCSYIGIPMSTPYEDVKNILD